MALFPRDWRARYGVEFRELLAATPLTAAVILDVVRTATALQAAAHVALLRVLTALSVCSAVEVFAVRQHLSDNILWVPSTPARAATLALLAVAWVPVAIAAAEHLLRRMHRDPGPATQ